MHSESTTAAVRRAAAAAAAVRRAAAARTGLGADALAWEVFVLGAGAQRRGQEAAVRCRRRRPQHQRLRRRHGAPRCERAHCEHLRANVETKWSAPAVEQERSAAPANQARAGPAEGPRKLPSCPTRPLPVRRRARERQRARAASRDGAALPMRSEVSETSRKDPTRRLSFPRRQTAGARRSVLPETVPVAVNLGALVVVCSAPIPLDL